MTAMMEIQGVQRLCLLIGVRHDPLRKLVTYEWIPIPDGMTEQDFGRKFFRGFDVVERELVPK